jgi:hypothetical protein
LPSINRLIYLDQSFLSDVCFSTESPAHINVTRLFSKLNTLKRRNKISLVISDIHSLETSALNGHQTENMNKLWRFQNELACGKIAADWTDVFVAQHQRLLSNAGSDFYPVSDIGFDNHNQIQPETNVISTNSWRLRLHNQFTSPRNKMNDDFRLVLDRQVQDMPPCQSESECLNYVRGLWCKEILQAIESRQQSIEYLSSFKQLGEYPDATQIASLRIPQISDGPFYKIVGDVVRGSDELVMLQQWSEFLRTDSIGPCPSNRIRTAIEAVLLWTWYLGHRHNPKKFNEYFGVSRQNDINHIASFVPYVDALTTDKDMHNLCNNKVVGDELMRFPCKIFSKKNYNEFETWLDDLLV